MLDFESGQAANETAWNMSFSTSTFHSSYHPLPEIQEFVSALANEHPDLVEVVNIGSTGEQREMTALKISNTPKPVLGQKNGASARQKGAVVIMGAQHAREVRFLRGDLGHAQSLIPSLSVSGLQSLRLCISHMD